MVYPEGNWIDATPDSPYFIIGRTSYGKPILDRLLHYDTPLPQAVALAYLAFDSTRASVVDVEFPIDLVLLVGADGVLHEHRFTSADLASAHAFWHERLQSSLAEFPMDWAAPMWPGLPEAVPPPPSCRPTRRRSSRPAGRSPRSSLTVTWRSRDPTRRSDRGTIGDTAAVANESRMVFLGFGKFATADKIYALEPLARRRAWRRQRTRVWVEGLTAPIIASRTERTILHDMGQDAAAEAPIIADALDLAARLAAAAEAGRVDLSDLGRRARRLLAATAEPVRTDGLTD